MDTSYPGEDMDPENEYFVDAAETLTDEENVEESHVKEMDPTLWSCLWEELVEKVIARLPLKSIIQSQILSRKWRSLFHSVPFQAEVSSVSSRWSSYYPLYVSESRLIGYDPSSCKWHELFSLPQFPEDFCRGFSGPLAWTLSLCCVAGSLIVLSHFSSKTLHIFVTNPVNKSSRRLPPLDLSNDSPLHPRFDEWDDCVLVLPVSPYTYKVLVFTRKTNANKLQVRVYHSCLNSWSESQPGPALAGDIRGLDSGGYLGGVFYLAFLKSRDEVSCTLRSCLADMMLFYTYDVETGIFKEIVLDVQQVPDVPIRVCKLLVCGSELMLVVGQGSRAQDEEQRLEFVRAQISTGMELQDCGPDWGGFSQEHLYIPQDSFIVFRLDRKSFELEEISRGPPEKLSNRSFTGLVVSDKDCIYLQTESSEFLEDYEFGVVMFNLSQQVWTCLHLQSSAPSYDCENTSLTDFAFQPGLNPFALA